MKITYLFIIVALALSCKESAKQDSSPTEENVMEQINEKAEPASNDLKQNGDYSSLFNSLDCKVITAEEISTALGMTFIDTNNRTQCSFKSQWPDNKTWNLSILHYDMKKSDMERELKNFKSDETGMLKLDMSETGDTYLCNQHSHGYLTMYNLNYDGTILIRYGSIGESRGFSKEERLEHRDMALKLANVLLMKHKK